MIDLVSMPPPSRSLIAWAPMLMCTTCCSRCGYQGFAQFVTLGVHMGGVRGAWKRLGRILHHGGMWVPCGAYRYVGPSLHASALTLAISSAAVFQLQQSLILRAACGDARACSH